MNSTSNDISLTASAAARVQGYLSDQTDVVGLRLGITKTGCSGMAYVVDFAKELKDDDQVFVSRGIKVIVDEESLPYVAGTEIDFTRDGLNEGFRFRNPNVKAQCGCGESFTI